MTDDNSDTDAAEELLQKSKDQKRHQTDPSTSSEATPNLADAVADAYTDDISENLTIRDGNLAALFAGLEETGELEHVVNAAAGELDREADGESKAEALRLLVRIALNEVAPEALEAGAKGYQQYRESQDYEF